MAPVKLNASIQSGGKVSVVNLKIAQKNTIIFQTGAYKKLVRLIMMIELSYKVGRKLLWLITMTAQKPQLISFTHSEAVFWQSCKITKKRIFW